MEGRTINHFELLNHALKEVLCQAENNFFNRKEKLGALKNPFRAFLALKHLKFAENSTGFAENYRGCQAALAEFERLPSSSYHRFLFFKNLTRVS